MGNCQGFPGTPGLWTREAGAGSQAAVESIARSKLCVPITKDMVPQIVPGSFDVCAGSHSSLKGLLVCGWILNFYWGVTNNGYLMLPRC